ncbi:MAG: MBL fold metallo-hydrolase [Thermoplasmata archaeon]|nr:MBL fold metallo-hydrolase [Thermoplasmata archaeon]
MLEVHVLASGSDGNCTVIESDGEAIMIDAGISCKRILKQMEQEGVDKEMVKAILITHEHSDHVCGAGATARKLGVPIMCNQATFSVLNLGNVEYVPYDPSGSFDIGQFNVTPLPTSHNAIQPNAFYTRVDDKKVLLATDTGKLTFPIEAALREADIAVIEANYDNKMLVDGPYPYALKKLIGSEQGHMCNVDTANAIRRTMTEARRQIFLAHLSRTNNEPDIARETVADITGIKRMTIDCLEFFGDSRTLRA